MFASHSVSDLRGFRCLTLAVISVVLLAAWPARAQVSSTPTGTIQGTVSTQSGAVKLPGVLVTVQGTSDQPLAQQVSDADGRFALPDLPPARYRVRASLDGFEPLEREAVVAAGSVVSLMLDLAIESVSEHVDVVARAPVFEAQTLASTEEVKPAEAQLLVPGQGVQSALRLTTGVIELPGGNSIDGGRPDQAGLQIGAATLVDPATNLARLSLPADALDSVAVLPNPYEVEFGRFASGLVVVQTKRASDRWKVSMSTLEPSLRVKRFTVFDITGITVWQPSVEIGGPLKRGRIFLDQAVQYRYQTTDIPSRPETELKRQDMFTSLTRVDTILSPRHSLIVSGGFAPSTTRQATLGTFTPPDATVNIGDDVAHGAIAERALLGKGTEIESTIEAHTYRTDVDPHGNAQMTLLPETTRGNFFNVQRRRTDSLQWIEAASHSYKGLGGVHLFKAGLDVLHSTYDGSSDSTPLFIARSDGTLARRLDFEPHTEQSVHSTDAAVFVQDRFQPAPRMYVEYGARVDHDGITAQSNVSPRVGLVLQLNRSGTAALHGGYGLFVERTPSVAGAFDQFEHSRDTRFAADGVTPLGAPIPFARRVAPNLQTARSATWDVAFDHRVNRAVTLHAGMLDREGSHALIVEPVRPPAPSGVGGAHGGEYLMNSTGRSSYVQEEVEVHVARGTRSDLNASYVHSSAREDLNSLLNFLDVVVQPVVGENAYAPAMADAPNRLLLRGWTKLTPGWQLLGTIDWRTGLPYSVVDDDLEFVGARNALRFPTYFRVDAGVERRLAIAKFHPWVGLRISNALNSFLPADVQANLSSPAFGSFYNSVWREYRIAFRFGS
jgi:carboxypeptidase family protein/TonB-dependent receptor-like protein